MQLFNRQNRANAGNSTSGLSQRKPAESAKPKKVLGLFPQSSQTKVAAKPAPKKPPSHAATGPFKFLSSAASPQRTRRSRSPLPAFGGLFSGASGGVSGKVVGKITSTRKSAAGYLISQGTLVLPNCSRRFYFSSGDDKHHCMPPGDFVISNYRPDRSEKGSMCEDGESYSFNVTDNSRYAIANDQLDTGREHGKLRQKMRIHPNGAGPGTWGCLGINGPAPVQRDFETHMAALLAKNGGEYPLTLR